MAEKNNKFRIFILYI